LTFRFFIFNAKEPPFACDAQIHCCGIIGEYGPKEPLNNSDL
jgi:hypothetical protein